VSMSEWCQNDLVVIASNGWVEELYFRVSKSVLATNRRREIDTLTDLDNRIDIVVVNGFACIRP
jgi:hypothetical protein